MEMVVQVTEVQTLNISQLITISIYHHVGTLLQVVELLSAVGCHMLRVALSASRR